jgi:hypothetical protein
MKIAIHQPYFFPYIGYFGLIKNTDKWVVFDIPQFEYHGWIERNRILKPVEGWCYIQVPLKKHSHKISIKDIEIRDNEDWRSTIFGKIKVYKKISPFYNEINEVIEKSLSIKTNSITELNCNTIKEVCKYLGIEWNYSIYSNMNLKVDDTGPLNNCLSIGNVSEYWNLPGGIKLYNKEEFRKHNIKLCFFNQKIIEYNQKRESFEPRLSIIDVMMFNSVEKINEMLNQYELL